jgi:hypothetical protein
VKEERRRAQADRTWNWTEEGVEGVGTGKDTHLSQLVGCMASEDILRSVRLFVVDRDM